MNEKQYNKYQQSIKKYKSSLKKNTTKSNDIFETRYKKSFEISIDVSKLLKVYNSYLKNIENILINLNLDNEKDLLKYKKINKNLSNKINDMQKDLSQNVTKLKNNVLYENDIKHYNILVNNINRDTSKIIF